MQGGFGAGDAFGVNAGLQVGDPLGGSNLLMPIVVGLGVLTFINIIADMFAWFGRNEPNKPNNDDGDDDDDARRGRSVKTLYLICCYNIYDISNVLLIITGLVARSPTWPSPCSTPSRTCRTSTRPRSNPKDDVQVVQNQNV